MKSNLHNLVEVLELSYNEVDKDKYLRAAKKTVKEFAEKVLNLSKDNYSIRVNRSGIASSGDVILHTDKFYISLDPENNRLMYRSCKGRNDFSGGKNNWISLEEAFSSDYQKFAETLMKI